MGIAGFVFQQVLFYPLRNRSFLAFIIATIGFSIFARNLALLIWGPYPLKVPSFFQDNVVNVANVVLAPEHLFIIAITLVVLLGQYGCSSIPISAAACAPRHRTPKWLSSWVFVRAE